MTKFALIDIETNFKNQVMSIGVVISDDTNFTIFDARYFVVNDVSHFGFYQHSMDLALFYAQDLAASLTVNTTQTKVKLLLEAFLIEHNIKHIFAYCAKFDYSHLTYLHHYHWYDIIEKSAYIQFNPYITNIDLCHKTGRLKRGYGVESIYRLLTNQPFYQEKHNGLTDAVDELVIMQILGYKVCDYHPINLVKRQ